MTQPDVKEKYSVLIVEDNLDLHEILRRILEKEGFKTKFVTTSEQSLQLLKNEKFDAVLLDYQLAPDSSRDGIETLKEIRKDNINVATIIMTAYGTQDLAIEAIKNQSDDFLIKPIDYANLGKILRETIKRRREIFPLEEKVIINNENIENINPFNNFIILKNSIPIFMKGDWSEDNDDDIVNTSNSFENQLLMSGFLSAMQNFSRSIFGQSVNELKLGEWNIIFKQKNIFLCAIKLKMHEFNYINKKSDSKNSLLVTLEEIIDYLVLEFTASDFIRLHDIQRDFIIKKFESGFNTLYSNNSTKQSKSFFSWLRKKSK